ncbi:MAG: hypothetical protein O3B73_00790 [bacterium]|nr:hypothetical protein [bacterium]
MMTELERFQATVAHQKHNEWLYHAGFTPDLERRIRERFGLGPTNSISRYFGMFEPVSVGLRPPENLEKPDFWPYYREMEIAEGAKLDGFGVLHEPGSMYHFTHRISPLRNAEKLEDIETFPYPNLDGFTDESMAAQVEQAHAAGRVATCWIGHMYETAWQIRDYEGFLIDMVTRPEWANYILDRLTERNIKVAEAAARAGVDYLRTGDDVANQNSLMFSPDQWRTFIKARWAKVYDAARAIKPDIEIWYHSDGNIEAIIPELIEIGVTILNPVQPECMDVLEIKRSYGQDLVLDGVIGTQTTMPFGSPDDVRAIVRERIKTLGYDGAFIGAPTHVLEPEVPIENFEAFVEVMQQRVKHDFS